MNKVKYTREEYRNEYLKSEEWQSLRKMVMDSNPLCQCCNNAVAVDVHHLIYKNLVDVTVDELLPVCRSCHKYIHKAISDGYISQDPNQLKEIKEKTINILNDEKYEELKNWLSTSHSLSQTEIEIIKSDKSQFLIKRIKGLTKKQIWLEDLNSCKFTGRQIEKIRKLFNTFEYRKKLKSEPKLKKTFNPITSALKKKRSKLSKIQKRSKPWRFQEEILELKLDIKELEDKLRE